MFENKLMKLNCNSSDEDNSDIGSDWSDISDDSFSSSVGSLFLMKFM